MPRSAVIVQPIGRKPFAYLTKMAQPVQQLFEAQEAARRVGGAAPWPLLARDSAAETGGGVPTDFGCGRRGVGRVRLPRPPDPGADVHRLPKPQGCPLTP